MPEPKRSPCGYHVVRYTPNIVRDEWVNIGVVLFDTESGRVLRRMMGEQAEFARVRRLHPQADESLLRRLSEELEVQLAGGNGDGLKQIERLTETLANTLQLSPRHGLLAEDLDAELDRLYRAFVEPPHFKRQFEDLTTRSAILTRADQVFRTAGIWARLDRRVPVDQYTFAGDPLRIDYSYRRTCTRGFVQALPLGRDPGQAKLLAFTADSIREKVAKSEFLAVSEVEPRPQDNPRHRFVTGLLQEHDVPVVPLACFLAEWAQRMRSSLLAPNGHS